MKYAKKSVIDWLKPIILIVAGGMILHEPGQGIAAFGLLLAFYLMLDAFSSFSIAQSHYPGKGWGWMFINGLMSVVLSILFLIGWPETSLWLVGLYVAISLFFDGLALTLIGWTAKEV
ncbi:MAG: HdeD family acid-resistance protein [bacterium]